jgi:serine/threonine protein kinase
MAPEVFSVDTPYNSKCDVYSFAILFWQILSLKKPYDELKKEYSFVSKVMFGGHRPPIKKKWSKACRQLLENSWNADQKQRHSMADVNAVLKDEVSRLWECSESEFLDTSRRRSTFVFRGLSSKVISQQVEA